MNMDDYRNEYENEEKTYSYDENSYRSRSEFSEEAAPKNRKKAKGSAGIRIAALAVCCSLLSGIAGAVAVTLVNRSSTKSTDSEVSLAETSAIVDETDSTGESVAYQSGRTSSTIVLNTVSTGDVMTPAEIYAENVEATVGIQTEITTNYWGYQTTSAAAGSGFIFTSDGYILTNYHVIEDASSITVVTYNGDSYEATAIGYDETNDIAVLKIDAENLRTVIIGDSDALNVGDQVIAIGNPLGELTFSLTSGYVSALNREVTFSSGVSMNLIQTDCAINSGNSGGALFNMYGEVIGVTNAKMSSSSSSSSASIDNIGFAIPINSVLDIVTSMIEKGYISKPYVGISVSTVGSEAQSYGIPLGAAVRSVADDSPASEAGLQANDVITKVNGTEITSSTELVNVIQAGTPGDVLELTVYRNGETITISVTIGEQIQSALPETSEADTGTSQSSGNGNTFPGWGYPGSNGNR